MCNGEHTTGRRFNTRSCQTENVVYSFSTKQISSSVHQNENCSHHDIADNLLTWHQTTSTHSLNTFYHSLETLTNLATYCIISIKVAIVPLWTRLTSGTKPTLDIFQRIPLFTTYMEFFF